MIAGYVELGLLPVVVIGLATLATLNLAMVARLRQRAGWPGRPAGDLSTPPNPAGTDRRHVGWILFDLALVVTVVAADVLGGRVLTIVTAFAFRKCPDLTMASC